MCLPLLCYVIESTLRSRFATRRSAVRSRSAPPIIAKVSRNIGGTLAYDLRRFGSAKKFKGDGVHPNRHSLRNIQMMDDDSSQDYLQRSRSVMKLLSQLIWHTANLKSGAQIRMKIQPVAVKMVMGSPASTNGSGPMQRTAIATVFGYCLEKRKGARA